MQLYTVCTRPGRPHSEGERERERRYSNLGNFQIGHVHHYKLTVNADDDRDDSLRAMFDSISFLFGILDGFLARLLPQKPILLLSRITSRYDFILFIRRVDVSFEKRFSKYAFPRVYVISN